MNVAELIKELQTVPNPEQTIVVQSIDSEGNSIRNTDEAGTGGHFVQDGSWDGDLVGPGEDSSSIPCVCFWPVN